MAEAPGVERIEVSHEMATILGVDAALHVRPSNDAVHLLFSGGGPGTPATVTLVGECSSRAAATDAEILLIVERQALDRLFAFDADAFAGLAFHLNTGLREITTSISGTNKRGTCREPYLVAKSIELLCECVEALQAKTLVPVAPEGAMTLSDSRRVIAARELIDRRWTEKLTLDEIARTCGINRAKLTRGFREMYRCSVSEALADRRLSEARRKLLTTDLTVSTIGYASGYLNNASFTRAFGRRFGLSPTDLRACRLAA